MVAVRTATLTGAGGTFRFIGRGNDPSGTDWIVEDVKGWFGGVGVRGEAVARLGHGEHVQRAWRAGRVLTLVATIVGADSDVRDDVQREVSGVLWDGEFGTLTCTVGDLELSTQVRLDGEVAVGELGTQGVPVQIPLRGETPWLYAPAQRVSVAPAGTGIGLVYPFYAPTGVVSYGALSEATTGVLTNTGNADAWPVFWIRGQMPTGFRVMQDGHPIEWSGSVSQDSLVAVDTARSAVEVWGTDMSHQLALDDFQPIPAGASTSITFQPLGGGTGYLEASLSSTFI